MTIKRNDSIDKRLFGKLPNGEDVYIYRLTDGTATAEIMEYGAAIVSLYPFGDVDVVGGFDTLEHYLTDTSNQGAIVGRVANRIENAQFKPDDKVYQLTANDNGNCLHSGVGFHHRLWTVKEHTNNSITLSYYSPHGEDGFPANLDVEVTYTILNSSLLISYQAIPDNATPIALTNHAYFNLDEFGGDIRKHKLPIFADRYTVVNEKLIPSGNRPNVAGSNIDFRELRFIDDGSGEFNGYDNNMILSPTSYKSFNEKDLGLVAIAENEHMRMKVYTDQPGMQLYTGYFLGNGPDFKNNIPQIQFGAFCLETQTEPNCVKHNEAIYPLGDIYRHYTVYEFLSK